MNKRIPHLLLFITIGLFFTACIKDTDFNQTDAIEITPIIELDFVFFDLAANNFTEIGVNNIVVTDTTGFDFLSDDFTSDNLVRAEFLLKFTNSFPTSFISEIKFLDAENQTQFEMIVPIDTGSNSTPAITEHIETIENETIIDLTNAEKVVYIITANDPVEGDSGNLKLQSKTTYYLKIVQ